MSEQRQGAGIKNVGVKHVDTCVIFFFFLKI